ncbi:MAG: hypothetical protein A2096_02655 [Spirochaetes bacterium GWF1_41_5]|nr:MAG: hypothetical protein A2096_02655 [Spirochaetes bacterium GWF1_41_5]HBE01560.1 hypothetical protein [Spirochaetia bacterium]
MWFSGLLLLDLISKLSVYFFLQTKSFLYKGQFGFKPAFNHTGTGALPGLFLKPAIGELAGAALIFFLIGTAVLILKKIKKLRYLVFLSLAAALVIIFSPGLNLPVSDRLPAATIILISRISALYMLMCFWAAAGSGLFQAGFMLLVCGAAGNLFFMLLPPFCGIDFIYWKYAPGQYTAVIFNLADIYISAGVPVLAAGAVISGVRLIIRKV